MNESLIQATLDGSRAARSTIAREELFPSLPEHVIEITHCEVAYTLHPRGLPYNQVDFATLRKVLQDTYSLRYKWPDINELAPLLAQGRANPSIDEVGDYMLSQELTTLAFRDGLLRFDDGTAINIPRINFTKENVLAAVVGPTRAGEQVIEELIPLLWAIAGVRKEWANLQNDHQAVLYGSGTRVQFPDRGLALLSPNLRGLFDRWAQPEGIGARMGRRDRLDDWAPPEHAVVHHSLDELVTLFTRQAPTGAGSTCQVRIGVDRTGERGSGRMTVVSELPFPEHLTLVESLVKL